MGAHRYAYNDRALSKVLTSDFESIIHVDDATDFYLEFFTGPDDDLEIRPGGIDFFKDARERLLESVSEADVQKLRKATIITLSLVCGRKAMTGTGVRNRGTSSVNGVS